MTTGEKLITPNEGVDPMDELWCCFACSAKFRFGKIIVSDALKCPKCRSVDLHPIGQEQVELKEYRGEIGTKN